MYLFIFTRYKCVPRESGLNTCSKPHWLSVCMAQSIALRAATPVTGVRIPVQPAIFRLPGTSVPKALCFTTDVFFYFSCHAISELPWLIAVKLCHMIAMWVRFIMQVQKFGGHSPPKKLGAKNMQNRRDFRQLQTSIANISGTGKIGKT